MIKLLTKNEIENLKEYFIDLECLQYSVHVVHYPKSHIIRDFSNIKNCWSITFDKNTKLVKKIDYFWDEYSKIKNKYNIKNTGFFVNNEEILGKSCKYKQKSYKEFDLDDFLSANNSSVLEVAPSMNDEFNKKLDKEYLSAIKSLAPKLGFSHILDDDTSFVTVDIVDKETFGLLFEYFN